MSGCKPLRLPLDPNLKLDAYMGMPLKDPDWYRRLTGKLIYLSINRPDIDFSV